MAFWAFSDSIDDNVYANMVSQLMNIADQHLSVPDNNIESDCECDYPL